MELTIKALQQVKTVPCKQGTVLLRALIEHDFFVSSPCGGAHTCGKCKVNTDGKGLSAITQEERRFLSEEDIKNGVRLACMATVEGNTTVILKGSAEANIQNFGFMKEVFPTPWLVKKHLLLDEATLTDQRDDCQRIMDALPGISIHSCALSNLPVGRDITVLLLDDEIINIEEGNTTNSLFGAAIDIGTTTVVAYLINLQTGAVAATKSGLNAQKQFGDDVITRINYCVEKNDGLLTLQKAICEQINYLLNGLKKEAGIQTIDSVHIAGNTTMLHLLMGNSPENISKAPFIPAFTQKLTLFSTPVNNGGLVELLPSVSGYIGADIVAGIAACGLMEQYGVQLLIDIGTNGEIALWDGEKLTCCSTAAGPAFEGAQIACGTGGISGAISSVCMEGEEIELKTIHDAPAIGICGSGLVDAVAVFLEHGIIDETGRMLEKDELPAFLQRYSTEVNGEPTFLLTDKVYVTQKDIRQLQLAKAAIMAGVLTLLDACGKTPEDISTLYLCGGFGSFLNKDSAVSIGLLPDIAMDKIIPAGNTSGSGTVLSLLSREQFKKMESIRQQAEYIELSANLKFQGFYMECMYF